MELKLLVEAPSGARVDLEVDVEPDTPLQELVAALAQYLELPPDSARSALLERSGIRLGGDTPVREAGLRDGDRITLGEGSPTSGPAGNGVPALFDLVVVAGPGAGTRRALNAGRHVVGRGPGADVVLSDRSMSRRHFAVEIMSTGVTVSDLGSSNGTFVEGAPLAGEHRIMEAEAVEAGRSLIAFEPHAPFTTGRADEAGEVAFNRPPRVALPADEAPVQLAAPPPEAPERGGLPLGAAAAPLALGVGMFAATGRAYLLLVGLAAPAMAVWSHFSARRAGSAVHRAALAAWRLELDEAAAAAATMRERELEKRRAAAPDAAHLRARAGALAPELWERSPADPDFLSLRVGVADLPPKAPATVAQGGDAALREEALKRLGADLPLPNVPVVVPLASGAAGLAGRAGTVDALARWLVSQAAVLHSPRELELAAAVDRRRAGEWQWLKWLPHARANSIVTSRDEAQELLAQSPAGFRLMVVDGELGLSPLAVEQAMAGGTHVIWLAKARRELPGACTSVIELDADVARGRVTDVATGAVLDDVVADGVTLEWSDELARLLAPVRDAGMRTATTLPRRVSLLELLELEEPTPAAVSARWETEADGLPAPIGRTAEGPFAIDAAPLEGFRMLLAGMPGAGKSELLQAMIAALAASHPPTRLSFLLVDYKGGAAFRDCLALPHTVGLITDLDARLADRARVSLLAELRRREAELEAAGARSLRELARRRPADAPPALLVIVDEFAALARELPAFVETLVDVAQRGRSLGLQLVLATQRPRGVVGDALRANMNLRVAMRVSDAAESLDVIDAPDAAAIPASVPGRAVALTGRGPDGGPQLTTFQAAYAGGRTSGLTRGGVRIRRLGGDEPDRELQRVLSSVGGSRPTDLQALVACAELAAERLDLRRPRPPWLPPLPPRVDLDDLAALAPPQVALGLLDDPEGQAQPVYAFDLERDGGMLVFGAGGSGRTAVLRALACGLAAATGPDSVQLYALDFGSRALAGLEALPHVGATIAADDEERVLRLLGALTRALEARRELIGRGERPGGAGFPRVLLLLDGYGAFAAAFERVRFGEAVQAITRLAADGRALGIHVVITADRRADVPGSLTGVLGARLVLRMAGEDEYTALGVPRTLAAGAVLPPGRGFVGAHEVQIAWVDPDELPARAEAALAAHPNVVAPTVPRLPARVPLARLPAPTRPLQAIIGVDGELVAPVAVDLADEHFLVAGPRRSGLSTALGTLARSLAAGPDPPALHLLAPRSTPLATWNGWASVARGPDECAAAAERLAAAFEAPAVVVLDDGMELGDGVGAAAVEALLRTGRDHPLRLVAGVEAAAAQRAYGGWVRELRAQRRGLLLQPSSEDGDLLGARLGSPAGRLPPGRGFLVEHGTALLVQVAFSEAPSE